MTEGNGTAINIHDVGVDTGFTDHCYCLRSEGFVQLNEVNLGKVHTRLLQHLGNCRYRADSHDTRMNTGTRAVYKPRNWLKAKFIHHRFAHHDHKCSAV